MSGDCRTFQYLKDLRLKYLKKRKTLQREYEFYKGNCKKARYGQYHVINQIFIDWYKKCPAHILESGPMLKEEYKRKIEQR